MLEPNLLLIVLLAIPLLGLVSLPILVEKTARTELVSFRVRNRQILR